MKFTEKEENMSVTENKPAGRGDVGNRNRRSLEYNSENRLNRID